MAKNNAPKAQRVSVFPLKDDNNEQFMNSPAYPGSWQQALIDSIGAYCEIDFLIGTQNIIRKTGVIYEVGVSFVVLFNQKTKCYTICDLYSIKFVNFPNNGAVTDDDTGIVCG